MIPFFIKKKKKSIDSEAKFPRQHFSQFDFHATNSIDGKQKMYNEIYHLEQWLCQYTTTLAS